MALHSLVFISNSFCGFRDSLTFQHVDDTQINSVENFIKSKLPTILPNWKTQNENIQALKDEDFFGPVHVFDPSQFEFSPGDRMQINHIANYVREKISVAGAEYFNPNKNKSTSMKSKKLVGNHFGQKFAAPIGPTQSIDTTQTDRKTLFEKSVKFMKKRGISAKKTDEFTESMVSIESGRNGVEGNIQCILCKNLPSGHEPIKVQSNMKDSKLYWTFSNFGRHLNTHFKGRRTTKPAISDDENNSIPFNGDDDDFVPNSIHTHGHGLCDSDNQNHDENSNASLSIEPVDVSTFESLIYNQISDQLIRMKNTAMTHNEPHSEVKFLIGNKRHTLHTVGIDANGNCLFGASIHQTFQTKIGGIVQSNETKQLRADVVAHIKNNRSEFQTELKGSALGLWQSVETLDLEWACTRFLEIELPKNGTWGGSETLKAITQLKKVNILVINEKGDFHYPCRFNTQFEQTIILAYTTYQFEEHEVTDFEDGVANVSNVSILKRIHYDSVINIEQKDVFRMAKMLAAEAYQQMLDKGKTVSIDLL